MEHMSEPWPGIEAFPTHRATLSSSEYERARVCVNACAGISTENLESNLPIKELAIRYNACIKQRDVLLEALQSAIVLVEKDVIRARDSDRHILLDALSDWHDAIANAKP